MNVNDLELFLNEAFPVENALDYDNVGLIAGDRNKVVTAILVSLDLTDKAIEAAKEVGANVIVTHHPIIFGGIKRLTLDDCTGKTLIKLVQSGISVIACHTNLDLTDEFGNLAIASKLGAEEPKRLEGAVCGVVYELPMDMKLNDYCRKVSELNATLPIGGYGTELSDDETQLKRLLFTATVPIVPTIKGDKLTDTLEDTLALVVQTISETAAELL